MVHAVKTEVEMIYPSNLYPNFYPQNFYPQGSLNFGPQGSPSNTAFNAPFASTLYGYPQQGSQQGYPQQGYPQQTPGFIQGLPQPTNWQYPAQQQASLQQQAIQQLLAHQLAGQQYALRQPGLNGFNGLSNGVAQTAGAWQQPAWQQPQSIPEQINPAMQQQHILQQQPHTHLLQQLAQYHYLVAQQLTQLASQQAPQSSAIGYASQFPYAGQFVPGQLGANFVPGITMH
jgi:hypothetical protein